MGLIPPSAFKDPKGSEEEDLSFDPLLILSSLEDCSCYVAVSFYLVCSDEVWHPCLIFLYLLVFKSNLGIQKVFWGKMDVFVENGTWRHQAMHTWLQNIHSSSL